MDNNTNINDNQTPVVLNRKIPPYFLLAVVVILILGASAFILFNKGVLFNRLFSQETPETKEKALVTIKTKSYELSGERGVQIYLSDKGEAVELAAFQIKFIFSGNADGEKTTIKIPAQLKSEGWIFPISRIEKEDGKLVVKLSGARFGNSPYQIKGNLLLATVSSEENTDFSLTLDDPNTLLFSSDAVTKIPFDASAE